MQCCVVFEIIDGYEVVIEARERTCDPQETLNYVMAHFPNVNKKDEVDQLCDEHKQYAPLQENEKSLPDNTCNQFHEKLTVLSKSKHEKCLTDGTIIPDYRETEYWEKNNNRWNKNKILVLGEAIPNRAILVDELGNEQYTEQRNEISGQEERDRIAALTPEALENEIQGALNALADEAARLEKRAQIQRKIFNPVAWYEEEEQKLYNKYGILKE